MERREIIKIFLDKGLQLSKDALEFFLKNEDRIEEFLKNAESEKLPAVISLEFVKKILKEPSVEIIKSFKKWEGEISVSEISSILRKRYEKLSGILTKRLDLPNLISINKVSEKAKKFSLIGMVREKDEHEHSLIIEDKTGELKIFLRADDVRNILEDEVIGVVCSRKEDYFFAEKVFQPDIPLKREVKRLDRGLKAIFLSDFHLEKNNLPYLKNLENFLEKERPEIAFILGDISSKASEVKDFLSILPSRISIFVKGEIEKGEFDVTSFDEFVFLNVEGINFLLLHGSLLEKYEKRFRSIEDMLLQILKKRHLAPTFDEKLCMQDENLIIDPIPDIFACAHFHTPSFTNYKGTTIISTGSFLSQPIFWLINLSTREILKLDLREKI